MTKWPVLAVAIAYLYVFPYQRKLNNPNENVRLYMTAAMVENGRYEIDAQRTRWGWVNDAATHGGHVYSVKAPGASILAVPGYALYRGWSALTGSTFERTAALWCSRMTATILPTLLWSWFLLGFLRQRVVDPALADASFFAIMLGSPIYGYTMMLASHTTSAVAAFGAFMVLVQARRAAHVTDAQAFAAGALTAAVTWLEYQGLVASVVLACFGAFALWRLRGLRALAWFGLGGLLPTASTMHYQYHAFGNALTPGHLVLETPGFRTIHSQGFYGLVGPQPEALRMLLVDAGCGLLPLTPLLVVGLAGVVLQLRVRELRADALCTSLIVAGTVLAIASATYWRGGWTIGPRYLMTAVPFLALAALTPLERLSQRRRGLARGLSVGLVAAGMVAAGWPSAYYPHIPEEITRPLPQLFAPLIAGGYAPYNLGRLLGVRGPLAMLPLVLVALAALGYCMRGLPRRELLRAAPLAIIVAAVCLVPGSIRPHDEPGVEGAVAFVMKRWTPRN